MSGVLKSVPVKTKRTVNVSTEVNVGYVDVDVDIDLEDISTDILVEELMSRDSPIVAYFNILRIYEVMAAKKNELALAMMRAYIQNLTGRILP